MRSPDPEFYGTRLSEALRAAFERGWVVVWADPPRVSRQGEVTVERGRAQGYWVSSMWCPVRYEGERIVWAAGARGRPPIGALLLEERARGVAGVT